MKQLIHHLGQAYIRRICRSEYDSQKFRWINERPIEYRFLFETVTRFCPRRVLDVGSGKSAIPSVLRTCGCVVTAIDNIRDYWPRGMQNRHWHVVDDDVTSTRLSKQFDLIACISVLEHIVNCDDAIKSMFSLLAPEGHLVLTFPFNEEKYVENAYRLPGSIYGQDAPYPCQVYSRANVEAWCSAYNARIVTQEYWRLFTGDFWTCGEFVRPAERVSATEQHQLTCIVLEKCP